MARLFVALEPGTGAVAALARAREAAVAAGPGWRGVEDAALHVTLVFLGARPPEDVEVIGAALRAAVGRRPAPAIGLGGLVGLPPRRPHALALAVEDPTGALAALRADVAGALQAAGVFAGDDRPWRAHATIARARRRGAGGRLRLPDAAGPPSGAVFAPPAVTLFESRTLPAGAQYTARARVALA